MPVVCASFAPKIEMDCRDAAYRCRCPGWLRKATGVSKAAANG